MSALTPGSGNLITDVRGIKVGNAEDRNALTGVTVLTGDQPMTAAADIRGGAPGTRDTDLLDPTCLIEQVHAIVLSGGSVFGLDAAGGVVARLAAKGIGFTFTDQPLPCPIVPSAILFDLTNGGDKAWGETPPYRHLGIAALEAADKVFALGPAGAGLGCRAGAIQGGLGSASLQVDGFTVGALVAVNSVGSVADPRTGRLWAAQFAIGDEMGTGPLVPARQSASPSLSEGTKLTGGPGSNTTIAVVASDAVMTKSQCHRLAIMAADGMARAIRPVHHPYDGDTVFAVSTGNGDPVSPEQLGRIGTAAADTLTRAIGRAVFEVSTRQT